MVSLGVAAIVARVVVKPINSIDLKNPDIGESYSEIAPLLHRISEQNHEIDQQIAELTRSRKEFSLITENMSEGFIIIDSRTEVLSYNTAALKILGSDFTGSSRSVLVLNRSEAFRALSRTPSQASAARPTSRCPRSIPGNCNAGVHGKQRYRRSHDNP